MQEREGRISEAELDFALSVTERSVRTAQGAARFTSLCLMAVIVSRYPPGSAQDQAEDKLCSALGRIAMSSNDLHVIRRFRYEGLHGEARAVGAPQSRARKASQPRTL